jgi:hypothetical protein
MQGMPPALLTSIAFDEQFYTLKELQPTPDKLDLRDAKGKLGPLEKVVTTMGKLTVWAQLRSSGRQGSAIADDLISLPLPKILTGISRCWIMLVITAIRSWQIIKISLTGRLMRINMLLAARKSQD